MAVVIGKLLPSGDLIFCAYRVMSGFALQSGPLYTVSQKNIPGIFSCNWRKHCRIFMLLGTRVTEKLRNQ